MLVKTSDLIGSALDWAVSTLVGIEWEPGDIAAGEYGPGFKPSTDWSDGGPIIESESINLTTPCDDAPHWGAYMPYGISDDFERGPIPLIAAMRCFVASKLGDSINIPDDLIINQGAHP